MADDLPLNQGISVVSSNFRIYWVLSVRPFIGQHLQLFFGDNNLVLVQFYWMEKVFNKNSAKTQKSLSKKYLFDDFN